MKVNETLIDCNEVSHTYPRLCHFGMSGRAKRSEEALEVRVLVTMPVRTTLKLPADEFNPENLAWSSGSRRRAQFVERAFMVALATKKTTARPPGEGPASLRRGG